MSQSKNIYSRRLINRTIDKRTIHKDLKFVLDISSCDHFSDIIDEKRIQPYMTIDLYSKTNLNDLFDLPFNFYLVIVRLIN